MRRKNFILIIVGFVFSLCFTFGCQDKEAMAELEEMKAQAEVEEQNKEIVKSMFEAWGKGDFETFGEFLAPGYFFYSPSGNPNPMSREEMIEFGKMMHNAFPDSTFSIEEMIAVGDKVISRFIMRATHEGEFQGISATGNKIEVSGIVITRIENGKAVEDREEFDSWVR